MNLIVWYAHIAVNSTCGEGDFHCESGDQCVKPKWKCDGVQGCYDGTDEATDMCCMKLEHPHM